MSPSQKDFHKKLLGLVGEKTAVKHLKSQKYKILETNYKRSTGEIDIIAKDGDCTVFVEVKTRTSDVYGMPSEAVNVQKQLKYRKTAEFYLLEKGLSDSPCRFDVIEILDGQINHINNAFCM